MLYNTLSKKKERMKEEKRRKEGMKERKRKRRRLACKNPEPLCYTCIPCSWDFYNRIILSCSYSQFGKHAPNCKMGIPLTVVILYFMGDKLNFPCWSWV